MGPDDQKAVATDTVSNYSELTQSVGLLQGSGLRTADLSFQLFRINPIGGAFTGKATTKLIDKAVSNYSELTQSVGLEKSHRGTVYPTSFQLFRINPIGGVTEIWHTPEPPGFQLFRINPIGGAIAERSLPGAPLFPIIPN